MPAPNIPSFQVPLEYKSIDSFKSQYPTAPQDKQLQLRLFEASKKTYDELLGILFSSELQKRLIIEDEDDEEGSATEVISHVPNNVMRCPFKEYEKEKDGKFKLDKFGNKIVSMACDKQMDMLPYKIRVNDTKRPYCDTHKLWMDWDTWKPPLNETGFKTIIRKITSTMSESISNSTFPKEFPVVIYAVGFAEGILGEIYENQDEWVNNKAIFLSENFSYTLEDTIITNIESALYKAQDKLVKDMLKTWNVNEDIGGRGPTAAQAVLHPVATAKRLLGV